MVRLSSLVFLRLIKISLKYIAFLINQYNLRHTLHTIVLTLSIVQQEGLSSETVHKYSSVPNRRVGPNKRAGGKILRKH